MRRAGVQQCRHNLTRLLEPEDTGRAGHLSPKHTAPHCRRWLFPPVGDVCCSMTYVPLALFSYAVSADVVIIYNGRLRKNCGWRICVLQEVVVAYFMALRQNVPRGTKNDAEPQGVTFQVWSTCSPQCWLTLAVRHSASLL